MQQLKLWQQREKEWARSRAKREKSNKRNIFFNDSVMLLEAAARNDIDEGRSLGALVIGSFFVLPGFLPKHFRKLFPKNSITTVGFN